METSLYARFLTLTDEFGLIAEDLLVIPRAMEEEGADEQSQEEAEEVAEDAEAEGHHRQQPSVDEERDQVEDSQPQQAPSAIPTDLLYRDSPTADIPVSDRADRPSLKIDDQST